MAKFSCDFTSVELNDGRHGSTSARFGGESKMSAGLTAEDLIAILRPAAEALRDHYRATIRRLFKQRTGSLADSIQAKEGLSLDREYMDLSEASITVGPTGKHKGGNLGARSRAGSSDRRYAKHNRDAKARSISNAELAYFLEFGTPRISATHWMENANEEFEDTVQQIIEDEFDKMLKSKGLI